MIAIIDEIPEDEVEHLSEITPELQSLNENQAPMKIELVWGRIFEAVMVYMLRVVVT